MLEIPSELPIPKHEADFERMCAHIYGVVFDDPLPKINGRKGQEQRGVDVYITRKGHGKIGIQCKKYFKTKLTLKHIEEEITKADAGKQPISCLLIATTTPSDAALQQEVQRISDGRLAADKFDVTVDFWDDIENRIFAYPILQERYAPNSPGGALNRINRGHEEIKALSSSILTAVSDTKAMFGDVLLPLGRADSLNKIVSEHLDRTNALIKAGRFRDALENANALGRDLSGFDDHQKARWLLQRGVCLWLSKDDVAESSKLFAKAYECFPGDERMAAARIRGLLLTGEYEAAREAGREESERFPLSSYVWLAAANVRIMLGEPVTLDDAPPEMREEAEILHLVAISSHRRGDRTQALEFAERAAEHEESSFFARDAFLSFALEDCAQDPVLAFHGLLPANRRERLSKATSLFSPRSERLWRVQTEDVVGAVSNLGFALLMLGDAKAALALISEARANELHKPQILRIEMQALDALDRRLDALVVAREHLSELTIDASAAACEMAAAEGDVGFVTEIIEGARDRFPDQVEMLRHMSGLVWGATSRSGNKAKVIELIQRADPIGSGEIELLCQAAPLMRWAGRPEVAESMETVALSKIGLESSQGEIFVVAEMLFTARRWREASRLYERLLEQGAAVASKLHARLLACYAETGQRGRAKFLISSLPEGWIEDEDLRRAAMDIGQMAGDWNFLTPLARKQLEKLPRDAASWLFWMAVLDRVASPPEFQSELLRIPEDLSGSPRNVSALAVLELRYGQTVRGLRRFYRLIRINPDDPKTLSSYLLAILTNRIPFLESAPTIVGPGCYCVLEDGDGRRESFVLDPGDFEGLPERADFYHPVSEFAQLFLGRGVGEEVTVGLRFGATRMVRIVSIGSAYLRLLEIARERASRLEGLPNVQMLTLGDSGDPAKDIAPLYEMLRSSSSFSRRVMDAYAEGPLTLSKLAELLGRSPVDLCQGWPDEGPHLFVGTGSSEERQDAEELIRQREKPFVADSFALVELAMFETASALSTLGEIIISNRTKELLGRYDDHDLGASGFGSAYDAGGTIGFVEYDESYRTRRRDFARRLAKIIDENCRVEPSYGAFDDEESARISELLGEEAREVVLLAREHGAALLTLDGRLRLIAKHVYGVEGVWPHAVVTVAVESRFVTRRKASAFSAGAFLYRRSFVPLNAESIIWMFSQGNWSMQRGMGLLKTHLSAPETEFGSGESVIREFLRILILSNPQLGAYAEITGHLVEAILRRLDCPPNWLESMAEYLEDLLSEGTVGRYALEFLNNVPREEMNAKLRIIFARMLEARDRAKTSERNDTVRAKVLFCSRRPTFAVDKTAHISQVVIKERSGSDEGQASRALTEIQQSSS